MQCWVFVQTRGKVNGLLVPPKLNFTYFSPRYDVDWEPSIFVVNVIFDLHSISSEERHLSIFENINSGSSHGHTFIFEIPARL